MKRALSPIFNAAIASIVLTVGVTIGWPTLGRSQGEPESIEALQVTDKPLTIMGALSPESEVLAEDGTYYNTHTFSGEVGQQVVIEMTSTEFDTYLLLLAPDGNVVAQNDDSDGSNSRLVITLPTTGTYAIIANSYGASETGEYTIMLRPATSTDLVLAGTLAEAFDLVSQGNDQVDVGEFSAALQSFQRALGIFQESDAREAESLALLGLGRTYDVQGSYSQALEFYEQALALQREINYLDGQGTTLLGIGGLYASQGSYLQALDYYQQAVANSRSTGNRLIEGVALNNIGTVYISQGQYSQALDHYQQALAIRKEIDDRLGEGVTLVNIGEVYSNQGQNQQALEYYEQALGILREVGDRGDEGDVFNNIGAVYLDLGQYPQALEQFQQALAIRQEVGDRAGEGVTYGNLGSLYTSLGQYPQALIYYHHALKIQQEIGDRAGEGNTLDSTGGLYNSLGDYAQALDYYQQALAIRREIGDRAGEGVSLNNIGEIYRIQRQYLQALDYHQQALDIRRDVGDRLGEGVSLGNIAITYDDLGQHSQALEQYQQALTILREVGDRTGEGTILNNVALLEWENGNLASALNFFQQGAVLREEGLDLILTIGSDSQKRDYISTLSGQTEAIFSFHLQGAPDNPEAAELALTVALQRKGRILDAVNDNLQALRQNLAPTDQQLLTQLQGARSQLANVFYNRESEGTPEQYQTQVANLRSQVDQLESLLAQRSADFRVASQPINVETVRQMIPSDAALIEIVLHRPFMVGSNPNEKWGEPRYAAYILHPDGSIYSVDLGEAEPIDQAIREYLTQMQQPASLDATRTAGRTLDALILHPIRPYLDSAQHLLISPDGQLNLIPFAALVDENGQYLIENYTPTTLVSGRDLLKLQLDRPSQQDPVIVANPDFNTANSSVAQIPDGSSIRSTDTQRSTDLTTLDFNPLPGTQTEAEAIAPFLPNATLLTGADATEAALTQLNAPSILHLATHGYFLNDVTPIVQGSRGSDGTIEFIPAATPPVPEGVPVSNENPLLRSGLALANFNPPRDEPGNNDGVLSALEVSSLNLYGTDLVVLSACQTGVGDVVNGEGVYGLRRAFALAGAESLLMSLWKVDDYGTAELMRRYYDRLIDDNEGRSEALRQVQLELLNAPAYEHPYYWAAFMLSGDWHPLDE